MKNRLIITLATAAVITITLLFVSSQLTSSADESAANTTSNIISTLNNSTLSPISIDYLRSQNFNSSVITFEEELPSTGNYTSYIASYQSEGNKIYGLLTVPSGDVPDGGFPAIIFNHGYIPPAQYKTTSGYVAYVDSLAKNGFVVFKIDYRGNGKSEGDPSGSYFSSAYTIDAIVALKSLQTLSNVNPNRIGFWGHSMAGNLVLRSMLVSSDIKAGVIWAGAVYSYQDFAKYRLSDTSYTHQPYETKEGVQEQNRDVTPEIQQLRSNPEIIDFNSAYWKSISLTQNINYLSSPIQIHHAINDPVVNIGYSRDLAAVLAQSSKTYELYEYEGGGHNVNSPYFETAMARTIKFFQQNL